VSGDTEISHSPSDGPVVRGFLREPEDSPVACAILVPGSRHERDSFESLAASLAELGIASLRIDVRGRGASAGVVPYARMGPIQRRGVRNDVGALISAVAERLGLGSGQTALVAEQDTSADAVLGGLDVDVGAIVVLSAHAARRALEALDDANPPLLGIVSTEDREGLRHTVDCYLASALEGSRLLLLRSRGVGATMFHTGESGELEAEIATWIRDVLTGSQVARH
jgi:hypothetical protein